MNNCSTKKATAITIVFCILLVLGIVLNMVIGPCTRDSKVRTVVITFTGGLEASNLQSSLETALGGSVTLNEKDKVTTTATTTTTKKATTTTTASTTTTTAATTTEGVAAAAETQTTTAANSATSTTTASGSTTTTTKAATTNTTLSSSAFRSGKMVATVSNCDEKSNDDIKRIFGEIFASDDYKAKNLTITDIYEVEPTNGFSWTQIYACVILLIVVFVYCLIRFNSIGSVASAVSVVIPAVVAVIGAIGAALILRIFNDISVSAVVAVATVSAVVFANIILENVKTGSDKDSCTVISITSVVCALLVLVAIVSLIAWNGEVMFTCFQYAAAVICSALASLAYVRCIMGKLAPKSLEKSKVSKKKPVIK